MSLVSVGISIYKSKKTNILHPYLPFCANIFLLSLKISFYKKEKLTLALIFLPFHANFVYIL